MNPILISNSFPFTLIRRRVVVEPRTVAELLTAMHERPWVSAWGHANTVHLASTIACADLRPAVVNPTLTLSEDGLPEFNGQTFAECWLLSITPVEGLTREQQREIQPEQIKDWQILRLSWHSETPA